MPRNVEIKARARDFGTQAQAARRIADNPPRVIHQEDTFFQVASGRLKLRKFSDGTGELIQYHREDSSGPKQSIYVLSPTLDSGSLKAALSNALGVRAVVRKRREVYFSGAARIHFDEVEGLGQFIELEVVLGPAQDAGEGVATAERLMTGLGIQASDLIAGAYVDLQQEGKSKR